MKAVAKEAMKLAAFLAAVVAVALVDRDVAAHAQALLMQIIYF